MAIDWEKEFNTSSSVKKSKINWDKEFNTSTNQKQVAQIQADRASLISQGKAVSNDTNKVNPSFGGSILRFPFQAIANPTTSLLNAGQIALGKKETQPFSSEYLGKFDGLGKIDFNQPMLSKDNLKTVKNAGSSGLEISSLLGAGGAVKNAAGQVIKQTFKQIAPRLLKEGALTGLAGSAGNQLRETGKIDLKILARDTAISTALMPIIGGLLNRAFPGKVLPLTPEENANVRAFGTKVRPDVPASGVPDVGYFNKNLPGLPERKQLLQLPAGGERPSINLPGERNPYRAPIELPSPGIMESQAKLREQPKIPTPVETPKTPQGTRAELNNSRQSFINKELKSQEIARSFPKGTIANIPKKQTSEQLGKVWNDAHGVGKPIKPTLSPLDPMIMNPNKIEVKPSPKVKTSFGNKALTQAEIEAKGKIIGTNSYGKPIYEKIPTEAPNITPEGQPVSPRGAPQVDNSIPKVDASVPNQSNPNVNTPEFTQNQKKFSDILQKQDTEIPPVFKGRTFEERASTAADIIAKDGESSLERIAMGLDNHPNLPKEDALGIMSKIAQERGDLALIDRLSNSDVGSISASNFNGLKLAGKNNIVSIIRELKSSLDKRFPYLVKKSEKETKVAIEKIKQYTKDMKLPKQEFNNLIDSIICK